MNGHALAVSESYNLAPSKFMKSWSQFAKQFAAASSILTAIPMGKFMEISDKQFNGDSLVIFRRRDFDSLNKLSTRASQVTRFLVQIDRMTTTCRGADDLGQVMELIQEQARLGIEFTVVPSTNSANDYFGETSISIANEDEFVLPKSRKDIEGE